MAGEADLVALGTAGKAGGWRERRTVGTAGEVDNGIDGGIGDIGTGRVERYVDGGMAALTDRHFPVVDAPHTFDTESVVCLYRPRADWPDPALSA